LGAARVAAPQAVSNFTLVDTRQEHQSAAMPFRRFSVLALLLLSFCAATSWAAYDLGKSPRVTPQEAAQLVADGKAVLVDVRESMEWDETGVAAPAFLLSTTDFSRGEKNWKDFLATVGDKTVITYCLAGVRAGRIADRLAEWGYKTANGGTFTAWKKAGLPVRKADEPRK
jgi:rhodanese-related sulfurtransferase